jgi:excisionase family DNA binding protein
MKPLKSIQEAAGLLGISPWTVRSYIRAGKLRPVKLGRRVLLEETELERFVAQGKGPNNSEQVEQAPRATERDSLLVCQKGSLTRGGGGFDRHHCAI